VCRSIRDYDLFAILADVRNGYGFGGFGSGEAVEPMSSGRGLPGDISPEAKTQACTGDHSATWVSLLEILNYD
jgi:hypothetical protein